jgi:hypothetical protein
VFITTAVKISDPTAILKDPHDMVHNPGLHSLQVVNNVLLQLDV